MEIQDRIIAETNRLLMLKSCRLITMDEIANNLGISKRTIYEQFTDKSSLLEESFNFIFDMTVKEVTSIAKESENSLISVMIILKMASESIKKVRFDYIEDLKKYYPKIYQKTFEKHIEFQKGLRNNLLQKALEDGFILEDTSLELLNSMLQFNLFHCSKNEFIREHSAHTSTQISAMGIFIILRGVSTYKGIEIIDKYKDILFR